MTPTFPLLLPSPLTWYKVPQAISLGLMRPFLSDASHPANSPLGPAQVFLLEKFAPEMPLTICRRSPWDLRIGIRSSRIIKNFLGLKSYTLRAVQLNGQRNEVFGNERPRSYRPSQDVTRVSAPEKPPAFPCQSQPLSAPAKVAGVLL